MSQEISHFDPRYVFGKAVIGGDNDGVVGTLVQIVYSASFGAMLGGAVGYAGGRAGVGKEVPLGLSALPFAFLPVAGTMMGGDIKDLGKERWKALIPGVLAALAACYVAHNKGAQARKKAR